MRTLAVLSCFAVAGTLAAQTTKLSAIPARFQNIEGASWHFKPYQDSNMVFQQVFSNDELPAALKTPGKVVTAIGFRNEGRFVGTFAARTIKNVTVTIGHTPAGVDGKNATTTFANNLDTKTAGYTKVIFQGDLSIPAFKSGQTNTIGTAVMIKSNRGPWVVRAKDRGFTTEIRAADPSNANKTTTYNCDRHFGSTNHIVSFIGAGCPANKNSMTVGTTAVQPGGSIDVTGTSTSVASGVGLNWLGTSLKNWGPLPLPFDLSKIGFGAGCNLLTDILLSQGVAISNSRFPATGSLKWPIPNAAGLIGVTLNSQYLVIDNAQTGGLGFSIAGQFLIGSPTKKGAINGTYLYFTGAGNMKTQATSNSGPWRNRADIQVVEHT